MSEGVALEHARERDRGADVFRTELACLLERRDRSRAIPIVGVLPPERVVGQRPAEDDQRLCLGRLQRDGLASFAARGLPRPGAQEIVDSWSWWSDRLLAVLRPVASPTDVVDYAPTAAPRITARSRRDDGETP